MQGLGGTRKPESSVIHSTFQGFIEVTTLEKRLKKVATRPKESEEDGYDSNAGKSTRTTLFSIT
jgi:hypothetical protein